LDSFGNLKFSVLKFWKVAGIWPENITIVSHEFKRRRFLDLHVEVARWPRNRVVFVGIDPEYMIMGSENWDQGRAEEVLKGEKERGFAAWEKDLLGTGSELRGKRARRNYWKVPQVWFESDEDRLKSAIRSRLINYEDGFEEVLCDEKQPWQDGEM